jgi:hypothetical protein
MTIDEINKLVPGDKIKFVIADSVTWLLVETIYTNATLGCRVIDDPAREGQPMSWALGGLTQIPELQL